jgi:hypothetical protein
MTNYVFPKLVALFSLSLFVAAGCANEEADSDEAVDSVSEAICSIPPNYCLPNPPPPPAPKPNLQPVTIDGNSGFCYGPNGNLLLRVRNTGSATAGASTTGVYFGAGNYHIPTPSLGVNASFDFEVPIPAGCFHPDCGFTIIADENGNVSEKIESDNQVSAYCAG